MAKKPPHINAHTLHYRLENQQDREQRAGQKFLLQTIPKKWTW